MKFKTILIFVLLPQLLVAQTSVEKPPLSNLDKMPPAPAYSDLKYWTAHPDLKDMADEVPGKGQLTNNQTNAQVDVFFVYPTIYTGEQHPEHPWFADVNDTQFNEKIANSTIKYQASVFNGSARIYSPLYRQAHIKVFFSDTLLMQKALDAAYQDVKIAFEHYLENWNQGRPIIIASHSQGTVHAARLMQEYFEGKPLQDKLVAAYIIGMPVQENYFPKIPICNSPDQIGCWMTWNTYATGYTPPNRQLFLTAASVNPLTWTTDTIRADRKLNKGGILKNFNRIHKRLTDAQNHEGKLWINKPRFFGNFLISWKRYHVVDYNLFYINIRENVEKRVSTYLEKG